VLVWEEYIKEHVKPVNETGGATRQEEQPVDEDEA
jgi:hypothetical protein